MGGTSLPSHKIVERWSNDGTYDVSNYTKIGKIKSITPNMEFSFELKIENMDSNIVHWDNEVLWIGGVASTWFWFIIKRSTEESKYYIRHVQYNGLGDHMDICQQNPLSYTNNWQKEFLSKSFLT